MTRRSAPREPNPPARALNILFVASEVVPFSKTGGLADVAGALPAALTALGHRVLVVTPRYPTAERAGVRTTPASPTIEVEFSGGAFRARLALEERDGVRIALLDCDALYDRPNPYGEGNRDYADNAIRFAFLCHGALAAAQALAFLPDVVHAHDWQAGLLPLLLERAAPDSALARAGRVLTIHNLAYQGLFDASTVETLDLPADLFHLDGYEFWGQVGFLKAGIVFADRVTTVSPRYAEEIQTEPFGAGLDGLLRARREQLVGILNGIDDRDWNPATDRHLAHPYRAGDVLGKAENKRALQRELGLEPRADAPLFAFIGRLTQQKGVDLIAAAIERLLALDTQFALLGTGDPALESAFRALGARHAGRAGVRIGFDESLAHRIEAGADVFLMPSRFEPCGLNQMYSLRYGTPPIVCPVGGLLDTVEPHDATRDTGTGFHVAEPTAAALLEACRTALDVYGDRESWRRLIERGMSLDFSWSRSARVYEALYAEVAALRRGAARGSGTSPRRSG